MLDALGRSFVTALGVVAVICAQGNAAAQPGMGLPPPLKAKDLACIPRLGVVPDGELPRVVGSQRASSHLFGVGDTVIVDGSQGLEVGGEYFVRRLAPSYASTPGGYLQVLHTAGWVRITAVEGRTAIATVVNGCDGFLRDDFLQPAEWPQPPTPAPPGQADYTDTGTILFGEEGRSVAGSGDFVVVDRGSNNAWQLGQRVTVYREPADRTGPVTELGEAFVVEATPAWSIVQVLKARDFIYTGDGIAPQK